MNKALLVISFGTSHKETRETTIGAIEKDLQDAFRDRQFFHAYTSRHILKKLYSNEGIEIDDPEEALQRIAAEGIKNVLIQSTLMTGGAEYEKIRFQALKYRDRFETLLFGEPVLSGEEDIHLLAAALEKIFENTDQEDLIAFMGHGGEALVSNPYVLLDECFRKDGCPNFCVGTAEAGPGFEPVLERVKGRSPRKVILTPLMIAAGEHALKDLTGSGSSWEYRLKREGYETRTILKGLGEYPEFRNILVQHAKRAVEL
ncbi:MAG: sirohydrochlorin cobaltochelatase [Lachnospiraceae bacterium]|nr:sirohydrochlorin cobaltochelatase [Lachnospiraceae bacterium]